MSLTIEVAAPAAEKNKTTPRLRYAVQPTPQPAESVPFPPGLDQPQQQQTVTSGVAQPTLTYNPPVMEPFTPPPIMILEPVRVLDTLTDIDEGMEEYVLRQSKNGNKTLSLVVGEKLFQVLSASREHGTVLCQHHFSIRRDTITGFNHNRFGWLKSARIALGVTAGLAFVFSSILTLISTTPFESGIVLFFLTLGGLILSLCRPHRLSFSTNGGTDSIFFFEAGSVKDLMTVNMAYVYTI